MVQARASGSLGVTVFPLLPNAAGDAPSFSSEDPGPQKPRHPSPAHTLPPGGAARTTALQVWPPGPTERPVGQRHGRAFPAASVTGPLHGLAEPSASGGITHTLTAL